MDHLDVVTTFLNSKVDDDIYMTLPEGPYAPAIIVRLKKALYGLKQAPWLWHKDINAFLLFLGFIQSLADSNLYIRGDSILILLYVDDIMIYLSPKPRSRSRRSFGKVQDHEHRPSTSISRHRNSPRWPWNQPWPEGLHHYHSQAIGHTTCPRCIDSHRTECKAGLGRGLGGEGIERHQRLPSDRRIIDVRSNSARYIICSHRSLPVELPPIHQSYDRCKESFPVSQVYIQLPSTLR